MPDVNVLKLQAISDESNAALSLSSSLDMLQHVADGAPGTPVGDLISAAVKDAVAGAGIGAAIGVGLGVGLTTLAVAIGADIATASIVVTSAAVAIGTGAGAGTALGSTLGPIGAVAGAVIGVLVALVTLGGAKGDDAGFSDPRNGTTLGGTAQLYFQDHPANPLLSVMFAANPIGQTAFINALGYQFDWTLFEAWLRDLTSGKHTRIYQATDKFFNELNKGGVPFSVTQNIIDLFCDTLSRVRNAEHVFYALFGGPGSSIDPTDRSHAGVWQSADEAAAHAFMGGAFKFDASGNRVWASMANAAYFNDVRNLLLKMAHTAYNKGTMKIDVNQQDLARGVHTYIFTKATGQKEGLQDAEYVLALHAVFGTPMNPRDPVPYALTHNGVGQGLSITQPQRDAVYTALQTGHVPPVSPIAQQTIDRMLGYQETIKQKNIAAATFGRKPTILSVLPQATMPVHTTASLQTPAGMGLLERFINWVENIFR